MANHTRVLIVSEHDADALRHRVRSKSLPARAVERARIVLLASEGLSADAIAERVGCSRPTVVQWRQRFAHGGLEALADAPRPGAPPRLPPSTREDILATTLAPPPERLGVSHWSSRLLGAHLGVSHMTVARTWHDYGLQPWRSQTFKFSTDPALVAKVRDIVGLYLNPPDPGAGPHRSDAADPTGSARATHA
jgi:transposase